MIVLKINALFLADPGTATLAAGLRQLADLLDAPAPLELNLAEKFQGINHTVSQHALVWNQRHNGSRVTAEGSVWELKEDAKSWRRLDTAPPGVSVSDDGKTFVK